jgi:hypothetical protein
MCLLNFLGNKKGLGKLPKAFEILELAMGIEPSIG